MKEKEEEKEIARELGREAGRKMRKELEENWKIHVIAGVIVVAWAFLILLPLNLAWYITCLLTFISYDIAYYSLRKLFKKIKASRK